jgi:hypothetical protein
MWSVKEIELEPKKVREGIAASGNPTDEPLTLSPLLEEKAEQKECNH